MSEQDNVLPFAKPAEQAPELSGDDRAVIMQTLANMMDFQEKLERGMTLATRVIGELQSHVRDLERKMAALEKSQPKKPAILNAQGARAN